MEVTGEGSDFASDKETIALCQQSKCCIKEDRLSALPIEVLRIIIRMVSVRSPASKNLDRQTLAYEAKKLNNSRGSSIAADATTSTASSSSRTVAGDTNNTTGSTSGTGSNIMAGGLTAPAACHLIRSCSKYLRGLSDGARSSISFHVQQQADAVPFMQKLPHLTAVAIAYDFTSHNITGSLQLLHNLLPALTSLTLSYVSNSSPEQTAKQYVFTGLDVNLDALLIPWSGTLCHLDLNNFKCFPTQGLVGSGLRFLSQLTALQTLRLNSVQPRLQNEDLAACTGLLVLSLTPSTAQMHSYMKFLDLSVFPFLQEISCRYCGLDQLNTAGLTSLLRLECSNNKIKLLDITTCSSLQHLSCSNNKLTHLDTTCLPSLRVLECSGNSLAQLQLLGCPMLTGLSFSSHGQVLTEMDLSACTVLKSLSYGGGNLTTLDVQLCPRLQLLSVYCNELNMLNLADMNQLKELTIGSRSLTSLDASGCAALNTIHCAQSTVLATICMSGCSTLQTLICEHCPKLQTVDLTGCVQLKALYCKDSVLESVDLTECVCLEEVNCSGSKLRILDVSPAATTLISLRSDRCSLLEILRATGCRKLDTLWCGMCPVLRELDCHGCDSLPSLWCRDSGRFNGHSLESLRAADWTVGELDVDV